MDGSAPQLTPEAYLTWEPAQPDRYEYIEGQVVARSPQTSAQKAILRNLITALKTRMYGNPCQLMTQVKVQVQQSFYYPDLVLSCNLLDRPAVSVVQHPCLAVEVLNPAIAPDCDRRFSYYRQLPTLQEYLLVDAQQVRMECWRRGASGDWHLNVWQAGDRIYLDTISFLCPITVAYQTVFFV